MWFYLPTVWPLWHPLIPLCNLPVFLFPLFICLLFQVSPAFPIVCHTHVFLLLPLPYFVSVILFASLPHLLCMASHPVHHHPVFRFFPSPILHLLLFYFPTLPLVLRSPPPPSIPQPRLLSSLPPLFCVYDSICHPQPPVWLPSLYNSALSLLLSSSPILCLLLLWLMFLCGSCSQRQSEFYYCWPPAL